jgi:predicted Zn-dependent protease
MSPVLAEVRLPQLGESESSLVTMAHERKVAEQVIRNLRHADLIVEDPIISEYIQALGNRIASQADWEGRGFYFFVVKDMEINAFALPAGYIGINAGLLLKSQSEDELAAVVAHEIAHVTQRHYNRVSTYSKQQNVVLAAALIAALAVGSNDTNTGMAVLLGSMAQNLHTQLAYSREHEKEADWIGMQLLQKSGFEDEGMVAFFERLHQADRFTDSELSMFLRTHPVTLSRLSDARARLTESKQMNMEKSHYSLIWYHLASLAEVNPAQYTAPKLNEIERDYVNALQEYKEKKYDQVITRLTRHNKEESNHYLLAMLLADAYQKTGKSSAALNIFKHLKELYPTQTSVTLGYAKLLLDNKRAEEAKLLLREAMRSGEQSVPELYQLLADIENQLGNPAASHRYLSVYYFETGRPHEALHQVDIALKQKGLGFYDREELEARQQDLRQHIRLLAELPEN